MNDQTKQDIQNQRYPLFNNGNPKLDFFKNAITAFLEDLRRNLRQFKPELPIYIFNTGDEFFTTTWQTGEKSETYQRIPRLICDVGDISIQSEQLSSNCVRGEFIETVDGQDVGYSAYVRRVPIQLPIECTLTVSSILDQLEFQEILLLILYKNNSFNFVYKGKNNKGVYRFPDDQTVEKNLNMAMDDQRRNRVIKFEISVGLQYPAFDYFNSNSLIESHHVIKDFDINVNTYDSLTIDPNIEFELNKQGDGLVPKTGSTFPKADGTMDYELSDELLEPKLKGAGTLKYGNSFENTPPISVHDVNELPKK